MIAIGAAFLVATLVCVIFLRRAIYNFADPLVFANLTVPFSAALMMFLCQSHLVSWDKFTLFSVVVISYLFGARVSTAFFGHEQFRDAIRSVILRLSRTEIYWLLIVTTGVTGILAYLALSMGGVGDSRQDFGRAFRPLVVLQGGLALFALLALLSPKLSKLEVLGWFVALTLPSFAFSGKGVFMPIVLWVGLRFFIRNKPIRVITLTVLIGGLVLGVAIMGLFAYGASSSGDILMLLVSRLWLSGDVYMYAYQKGALDMARADYHVPFFSYVFHPITSMVGIRGYEKPLGAMLASESLGTSVLTGPNPHLPVLLDYFFPDQILAAIPIAVATGVLVFSIRAFGIGLARSPRRYVALGGVCAAIFCPASGFSDTSLVLISLIGIILVACSATFLEMLFRRRTPRRRLTPAGVRPGISAE